tara:strand:+ start:362 stop:922 length:561 start_codon:yes stop_codon:yes gene_type:complete
MNNRKKYIIYFSFIVSFIILVIFLYNHLNKEKTKDIRSVYIGKKFPEINYPTTIIDGVKYDGFSQIDFSSNKLSVINIWASWCTPCRAEHEYLIELKNFSIPIYGVNYKDKLKNAKLFIEELGNPYKGIGFDLDGMSAISLGVYGIPETFLVDHNGIVIKKYIGPITSPEVDEIVDIFRKNFMDHY